MLIKGRDLTTRQREEVLSAYCHRHLDTTSKTDEEWLAKHAFYFIKSGARLSARYNHCVPEYLA